MFSNCHHGNKVSFPHYQDLWMVYELISWLTKMITMATNVFSHILLGGIKGSSFHPAKPISQLSLMQEIKALQGDRSIF